MTYDDKSVLFIDLWIIYKYSVWSNVEEFLDSLYVNMIL